MVSVSDFILNIRELIKKDELDEAFQQLERLFESSPQLDEIIQQIARFESLRKQIRLGTIRHDDAEITQNQIRQGLIDLLREIEKNKDILEGSISDFGENSEPHIFNLALTIAIVDGMAKYKEKARGLQKNADWQNQPGNLKRVQAFICRSFVGEIGKLLRQLIAIGNEIEMPAEKQRASYVLKCLDIVKRSLDLVSFAMMSKLWDVFRIAPRTLTESQKAKLQHRFDHNFEFLVAKQFELLSALFEIFKEHELELPFEELNDIELELKPGGGLRSVCEAFDSLNRGENEKYSYSDCTDSESQLADFFRYFSFLVNYKMASIKRIGYRQDRNTDPRYLHRYIALGIDQKATEDAEKVNFTDIGEATYAVLLYRGDNYERTENISLFPFVIDYNALTFEKGAKVCFFSFKEFDDDILHYRFLTDNSLIKIEKKDILKNVSDLNELMLEDKNRKILNIDMVTDGFRDARKTLLGDEIDFDDL